MKLAKKLGLSILALALAACTTDYQGGKPDFTKTGEAAKAEKARFHIDDMTIHMAEVQRHRYDMKSFRPVIQEVSPAADKELDRAKTWANADLILLSAAIVTLFQPSDSWWYRTGYWALIVPAIGSGIYSNHIASDAADIYNRDLETKFTPRVGASIRF